MNVTVQGEGSEMIVQPKMSFLCLPAEIRIMIYDLLIESTGTVTNFAQYAIGRNVSKQTLCLLHLNQLIRSEVQDFFYANQEFSFRSPSAVENFVRHVGARRVALIKKITIDQWLSARFYAQFNRDFMDVLRTFSGLEEVAFEEAKNRLWQDHPKAFVKAIRQYGLQTPVYQLGPSGYLVLGIWEKFLDGKIVLKIPSNWRVPNEVSFLTVDNARNGTDETMDVNNDNDNGRFANFSLLSVFNDATYPVEIPDVDEVRKELNNNLNKVISPEVQDQLADTKAREKKKRRQRQQYW